MPTEMRRVLSSYNGTENKQIQRIVDSSLNSLNYNKTEQKYTLPLYHNSKCKAIVNNLLNSAANSDLPTPQTQQYLQSLWHQQKLTNQKSENQKELSTQGMSEQVSTTQVTKKSKAGEMTVQEIINYPSDNKDTGTLKRSVMNNVNNLSHEDKGSDVIHTKNIIIEEDNDCVDTTIKITIPNTAYVDNDPTNVTTVQGIKNRLNSKESNMMSNTNLNLTDGKMIQKHDRTVSSTVFDKHKTTGIKSYKKSKLNTEGKSVYRKIVPANHEHSTASTHYKILDNIDSNINTKDFVQ